MKTSEFAAIEGISHRAEAHLAQSFKRYVQAYNQNSGDRHARRERFTACVCEVVDKEASTANFDTRVSFERTCKRAEQFTDDIEQCCALWYAARLFLVDDACRFAMQYPNDAQVCWLAKELCNSAWQIVHDTFGEWKSGDEQGISTFDLMMYLPNVRQFQLARRWAMGLPLSSHDLHILTPAARRAAITAFRAQ